MGTLLLSRVAVCEPIELLFAMVDGVGPGTDVWNGGPRASRGKGGFYATMSPLVTMRRPKFTSKTAPYPLTITTPI